MLSVPLRNHSFLSWAHQEQKHPLQYTGEAQGHPELEANIRGMPPRPHLLPLKRKVLSFPYEQLFYSSQTQTMSNNCLSLHRHLKSVNTILTGACWNSKKFKTQHVCCTGWNSSVLSLVWEIFSDSVFIYLAFPSIKWAPPLRKTARLLIAKLLKTEVKKKILKKIDEQTCITAMAEEEEDNKADGWGLTSQMKQRKLKTIGWERAGSWSGENC